MNKNVLLIFPQPDRLKETRFGTPLGLLYLGSALKEQGFEVQLLDFNSCSYNLDTLRDQLTGKSIAGISIPSYCLNSALNIITAIREICPEIKIAAGGADCILFPRLVEGTDVTFVSEAESTVADVFSGLLDGQPLNDYPGIFFRDQHGGINRTNDLMIECDLDLIDFPDRTLVDKYAQHGGNQLRKPKLLQSTQIITTRGCPYHCRFCARNALSYQKYRERSVTDVLTELQQIADQGYKMVWICDDNFAANITRAKKIMQGIIDSGINLSLAFSGWVKSADEGLYRLAKQAGVRIISFGIESGNQDVLDYYKKNITLEESRYAVELADKVGLYTVGNFIFGASLETERHFRNTIDFALDLPLDTVNFKILGYMAGSSLWNEYVKKGLIDKCERNIFADKNRGLSNFTYQELQKIVLDAEMEFKRDIKRKIRLSKKILKYGYPYEVIQI